VPAHRRNAALSASPARAKLSRPSQTLTSGLFAKNPPPSAPAGADSRPAARNALVDMRSFGVGCSSFLKAGKTAVGIAPRELAVGAGYGGCAVVGGPAVGLKTPWMSSASA
jgi:hypothetical protein